ncbi:type II secretion system protein GspM [Piscinibacter sp.]|uniref:type II secretion system protein GspM n=1 Tax=Piscinibacter sp. TaxID=1903157 RepID=UPI0039E5F684
MSARTPTLPPALAKAREQLRVWWRTRVPRERLALGVALAVVALFVAWLLLVQPALRTLREAPARLAVLDAELQQMQRLAAESQTLRGAAAVPPAQAAAALKAATDRLGDKGRLAMQGDRASLTLNGVSPEALRGWLLEARGAARVRPAEAQLTRGPQGYTGTLVVMLAGGGEAP